MKNVKDFDPVTNNPIEDQIVTIDAAPYPQVFIPRNSRMASRCVHQRLAPAPELLHERHCACWVVFGNPVAD